MVNVNHHPLGNKRGQLPKVHWPFRRHGLPGPDGAPTWEVFRMPRLGVNIPLDPTAQVAPGNRSLTAQMKNEIVLHVAR